MKKLHYSSLVALILFITTFFMLYQTLKNINIQSITNNINNLASTSICIAFLFTFLGYISLIGYDWSALKYIQKKVPFHIIILISFIGYSLSNTIGITLLSGGAVRYRLYRRFGLSLKEIAVVTTFCVVGFGIGETIIAWFAIAIRPDIVSNYFSSIFIDYFTITSLSIRVISVTIIITIIIVLFFYSWNNKELHWKDWSFTLPSAQILSGQIVFAIMDMTFAGATLFILLPNTPLPFISFLVIYTVALVASVFSNIPGGVGVFELVILFFLQDYLSIESITAALITYRTIYYIIPFLIGILLLGLYESYHKFKL